MVVGVKRTAVVGVHGEQGRRRGAGGLVQAAALGVTTGVAIGMTIDGPPPDESLHMQHPACWKNGIAIKTEPRIIFVFRHNTPYYNSVWAIG
jgi:hypothetical protein